jgi:phosphate transport system protein
VLLFDDTVDRFKREIGMSAQEQVAGGHLPVEFAFGLTAVTRSVERIADHCTNVCEQVIYLESGLIVRHRPEGWSEPASPTR